MSIITKKGSSNGTPKTLGLCNIFNMMMTNITKIAPIIPINRILRIHHIFRDKQYRYPF